MRRVASRILTSLARSLTFGRAHHRRSQSRPEASDLKQIAQFDKTIAGLTKELDQLRQAASAIEAEIKENQEEILKVGGVKLRSQQTKVQDLKAQIDLATDRLTKAEVGKAKSEKDTVKLAKSIEATTSALEVSEGELKELLAQIEGGAAESEAVRSGVEQAQEVLAEKREELAEMKKLLDDKVDIMTQFRKREVSVGRRWLRSRSADSRLLGPLGGAYARARWRQEATRRGAQGY